METRKFLFEAPIQRGCRSISLVVSAPVENGYVITNKYCPKVLLIGGSSFLNSISTGCINGERIEEFISDCQEQVISMSYVRKEQTPLDAHVIGLMTVVTNHLNRCGRLIFGDLLIYMDCFSYLLSADGFSDDEIKRIYPRITRKIVEYCPNYIKNTADLSPFKGSPIDQILYSL
jgi:hypothetical protein